jgi:predicted  nucleic acid-binding Zn-ribbon protein
MAEERRKDREEYKALWRDTQRQLDELGTKMIQWAEQSAAADARLEEKIAALADEGRETDRRLRQLGEATDARIAALVSAIGEHVRQGHPQG